jgi:hypothetical protein
VSGFFQNKFSELLKLGEKRGIAAKKTMDEIENDVKNARHKTSPVGADDGIL